MTTVPAVTQVVYKNNSWANSARDGERFEPQYSSRNRLRESSARKKIKKVRFGAVLQSAEKKTACDTCESYRNTPRP
jgi:hypothetical protein